MKNTLQLLAAALPLATAYPAVMEAVQLQKRVVYPTVPAPKFTTDRDNCGSHGEFSVPWWRDWAKSVSAAGKCTVFNAEDQYVDVTQGSGHE